MVFVKTSHTLADKRRLERLSDESASGVGLTLTSTSSDAGKNAARAWKLKSVHVRYSANFTGSVTIELQSALGATFNESLPALSFTAEVEQVFRPTDQICMNADDQIEVIAPSLASETVAIEVKRELL